MRRVILSAVLALACNGGSSPTDEDTEVGIDAELLGIGLSPREPVLAVDDTIEFQVRAFYDDTRTADISADVTWVSTETRVGTISERGELTALAVGTTQVIATDRRGVATTTTVSVKGEGDRPQSLVLAPRTVEMKPEQQVLLSANATYSDGTVGNLAGSCTWTSEDPSIASVSQGLVEGFAEGRTTVRASCGGLDAAAPVSVRAPEDDLELPDLVVQDLLFDVVDDELLLLVEVKNRGTGMSALGFVDVFIDTDGTPDEEDDEVQTEIIDALAPGDSEVVLLTVYDVSVGLHTAWVVPDADGWIEESDEDNAAGPYAFEVQAPGQPELEVRTFSGTTDGDYTFWTVQVRNTGSVAARDFWLDLWYDPAADPGVCDTGDDFIFVSRLDSGDTFLWEPDVDDGPDSEWLSVLYADSCDDVAESDETNNLDYAIVEP